MSAQGSLVLVLGLKGLGLGLDNLYLTGVLVVSQTLTMRSLSSLEDMEFQPEGQSQFTARLVG